MVVEYEIVNSGVVDALVDAVMRCQNAANIHTTNTALWYLRTMSQNANNESIEGRFNAHISIHLKKVLETFLVNRNVLWLDKERKRIYAEAKRLYPNVYAGE